MANGTSSRQTGRAGSRVVGGGNFIQAPASLQATINFGMEDVLRAPGRLFDALAEQAADEQEAAQAFLAIVAQSNPDMLPLILKDDPDLIRLMTTSKPQIQFPGGKGKDGQAKGGERGSLGLRTQVAVIKAQKELDRRKGLGKATFAQRQDTLGFLLPEESNPAAVDAVETYNFGEDSELVKQAFFYLHAKAPRSMERARLTGTGAAFLESVERYRESEHALTGVKPSRAQAIRVLQTSTVKKIEALALDVKILENRLTLQQFNIAKGKMLSFEQETAAFDDLARITENRAEVEQKIAEVEKILELQAAEVERLQEGPQVPGRKPSDTLLAAIDKIQGDIDPEDRASQQMLDTLMDLRERYVDFQKRLLIRISAIDASNPDLTPKQRKARKERLRKSAAVGPPPATIDELLRRTREAGVTLPSE